MYIRDICPQVLEEPTPTQDQPSSSVQASPPTKDEEQTQEEEDQIQDHEPPQDDGIDQGGMKSKKFKLKDHITQESIKQFSETDPSSLVSVTFKRG
jgi:hypothetical protein